MNGKKAHRQRHARRRLAANFNFLKGDFLNDSGNR
jgi:hypothetical protein